MTNSVWTTGGAIMTFCGLGIFIGFVISLFNSDVGGGIIIYSLAGLIITFIVAGIAYFLKESK